MSLSKLFGHPTEKGHSRGILVLALVSIILFIILSMLYPERILEVLLGMFLPLLVGAWTIHRVTKLAISDPKKITNFMIKAFGIKMLVYGLFIVILFVFYTFDHLSFVLSFLCFFSVLHALEAVYFSYLLKQS